MEIFINDLSKVWSQLSEDTQKNLSELIAGKWKANELNSYLKAFKVIILKK